MTVLIAGGGISGLALGLSCHAVGIPIQVYEAGAMLRPLGVGINQQPSAVRELYSLDLQSQLDAIGIHTRDYGMYSKRGLHIWTEPRGLHLGYKWPQYSVHRGLLHMMLYHELLDRAGSHSVVTGVRAIGFDNADDDAILHLEHANGQRFTRCGSVLIGADGIHSAIRKQMQPTEGEPTWGGAMLWRGTTLAVPFLTGASMVMIGYDGLRFVAYPISQPDPVSGHATINWIANLNFDPDSAYNKEDYNREADLADFLPAFEDFVFSWLNVPELVHNAERIYEFPMVDRDPLSQWTHGRVTLMGDAAHAAYPVGSNGAGAGIIDARELVAAFLQYGLTVDALLAYEEKMRPPTSKMILMNRTSGPDKILDVVEERCGGQFDRIEEVISRQEMDEHAALYKRSAGFGLKETNERPDIVAPGSRYGESQRSHSTS